MELFRQNFPTFLNGAICPAKFSHGEPPTPTPTPTLEGGEGPVKEAGTHSPPCLQYLPNIKPYAMQIGKGTPLLPQKISTWPSPLHLLPYLL